MSLIIRRIIRPRDVQLLVELMPSFQYSYGTDLDEKLLTRQLTRLLQERALSGIMLVRSDTSPHDYTQSPSCAQIVSFAVTGFIDTGQARELCETGGRRPVVEWLYAREDSDCPVFLRPDEQAQKNRGEGMALVFVHFFAPPGDPADPLIQKAVAEIQDCFRLLHAGHHCRMLLHPLAYDDDRGRSSLAAMGFEAVDDGRFLMRLNMDSLDAVPFHPFICLRRHEEPIIGFSMGEKQLLTLALWGYNDKAIAQQLHISFETVRKRWRWIFQKIEMHPELEILRSGYTETETATRGPEKRSVVLRYLESHLSEIRP